MQNANIKPAFSFSKVIVSDIMKDDMILKVTSTRKLFFTILFPLMYNE